MQKFLDLGEFRFISQLLDGACQLPAKGSLEPNNREWFGAGDDCCMLDGWLFTKDLSVEGTHFSLDWSSPEQAVEKHIVSNVSDINSMGGRAKFALLGLCINKNWSELTIARIRKKFSESFANRGIALVGGDTVSGNVGMFSTTLIGALNVKRPMLRKNALNNYNLYVNGTLGKSAAGLWLLQHARTFCSEFPRLVEYHLNPIINEFAGERIEHISEDYLEKVNIKNQGTACMDISDGLSSELNHLAIASNVNIQIDENLLPIDVDVLRMCERFNLNPLDFALNGGEEYELLFANSCPKSIFEKDVSVGCVYNIGRIFENFSGARVSMLCKNGKLEPIKPRAWSHL